MKAGDYVAAYKRHDERKRQGAGAQLKSALADIADRPEPLTDDEVATLDNVLAAAGVTRAQFGQQLEVIEQARILREKIAGLEALRPQHEYDSARRHHDAVLERHAKIIVADTAAMEQWRADRHAANALVTGWGARVTDLKNYRERLDKLEREHHDILAAA